MRAGPVLKQHPLRAGLAAATILVAAAALWLLFAPMSIGGNFGYVFLRGNSMNPLITEADIAFIRQADRYEVGDVVAYKHPQLGTVFHRIVDYDGFQFTLRGDNRPTDDSYRPVSEEIIGRHWATVPNGAPVLREIQRPRNAALLVGAFALLYAAKAATRRRSARKGRESAAGPAAGGNVSLRDRLSLYNPGTEQVLMALIGVLVISASLPLLVRLRGETHEISETIPIQQQGTFSYDQTLGSGVYDDDRVTAPEPVFRKLTDDLPIQYSYLLAPTAGGGDLTFLTGSYRLFVEVRQPNGWKRTLELQPTTLFAGNGFSTTQSLTLADIDRLVDDLETATEIRTDVSMLHIVAEVNIEGQLDGIPFTTTLEQAIDFLITDLQVQFSPANSVLEAFDTTTVSRPMEVPRRLSVPIVGVGIAYSAFPEVGLAGAVLGSLGLAVVLGATFLVWREGERARIHARHGHRMVDVGDEVDAGERPLDVKQFDDLVRIADRDGLVIIHHEDALADEYFVFEGEVTYRHTRWRADGPLGSVASSAGDDDRADRAA